MDFHLKNKKDQNNLNFDPIKSWHFLIQTSFYTFLKSKFYGRKTAIRTTCFKVQVYKEQDCQTDWLISALG